VKTIAEPGEASQLGIEAKLPLAKTFGIHRKVTSGATKVVEPRNLEYR
jgi:hypothetical protein